MKSQDYQSYYEVPRTIRVTMKSQDGSGTVMVTMKSQDNPGLSVTLADIISRHSF